VKAPRAWRWLAAHPTVLLVVAGLALYPVVREAPTPRVLKLSEGQTLRTLATERARSDAPETEESQRRALTRALEEEALAELAIAEELHRADDGLRHALAEAARARLGAGSVPSPSDDELHALLAEVPVEDLVDVDVAEGPGAPPERITGRSLAELEADLGLAHLPMPTRDGPIHLEAPRDGGARTVTLRVHPETEAQRIARARPELERRFRLRAAAAAERAALDGLFERYDRVERP
jgi:hypothetical protein